MDFYLFDEIVQAANCLEVAKNDLGMDEVKSGRFNCPWKPGSDSGALAINETGWFYHVDKTKGNVITLVANVKYGGDVGIQLAQEWLGKKYELKPNSHSKKKSKIIAEYSYRNIQGNEVFQCVRWEPKNFTQRHRDPDNPKNWIWNLEGIETIPYMLDEWHNEKFVLIAEGEKCAINVKKIGFPATTSPMGAEHWQPHFNQYFKDKDIVILIDNDDAGRLHGEVVSSHLKDFAKSIRIICLSDKPKGDVTDWIEDGGNHDKLKKIIKETKQIDKSKLKEPIRQTENEQLLTRAKIANKEAFQNFYLIDEQVGDTIKKKPKGKKTEELLLELNDRFLGFPKRVGSVLFDIDRKDSSTREMRDVNELLAWVDEKSKHITNWSNGPGMVKSERFFHSVRENSERYSSISYSPDFPPRKDVYYAHKPLLEPSANHKYFENFINYFCPATDADRILIKAFAAAALFYIPACPKPAWIIDSEDGQGSGKTTLVNSIARLHGGCDQSKQVIPINVALLKGQKHDEITKRLLSSGGRKRKIVLLDNITGNLKSGELSELITADAISGKPAYARGEESCSNHFVFVMTVNSASVDRDIADRSYYLHLSKPEYNADWANNLKQIIEADRLQILTDMLDILKNSTKSKLPTVTRFPEFERMILYPMCGNNDNYEELFKVIQQRKQESDVDIEYADRIIQTFVGHLATLSINPEKEKAFIKSTVAMDWVAEALPEFKRSDRAQIQLLKNLAKSGDIPQINHKKTEYNHNRGIYWNPIRDDKITSINFIGSDDQKKAIIVL